jgi:hypothetical protein
MTDGAARGLTMKTGMKMKDCRKKAFATVLLVFGLCLVGVAYAADTPEDIFWQSVRKSNLAEEYRLYTEQYPRGKYLEDARRRIATLEAMKRLKGFFATLCRSVSVWLWLPVWLVRSRKLLCVRF